MSTDPDLISVLTPYLSVCKRSDTARREKKLTRFRIYGAILSNKEFKKLTAEKRKWLKEWSRLERDPGKAKLQELVQRYIDRLREEAADHDKKRFDSNSVPIQKFQKIAEDMLETEPAWFSFLTTKTDDSCFVGLVQKHLKAESGDIENMTFYFLEDGVKESNTGGAAGGKEEGAMGGAAIQTHVHVATLVLPLDWEKSFAKSLKNNIHNCHGHVGPALEALRMGRDSYTDITGKTCKFTRSAGDRKLRQGVKIFKEKLSYKLDGKNPHGKSSLCKVHLNGDGSDCLLVYVVQNYMHAGRVFLLVGVHTHTECNITSGASTKEHSTKKGGDRGTLDITEDMEAARKYLH
ncbi:uncharacterized protein [Branchiostoma lanceolatum]|uniref:uncharacterized protein n=1 Tax=Branchiostoma lanceolatum TaxID=7740 RepID=UPI0034527566